MSIVIYQESHYVRVLDNDVTHLITSNAVREKRKIPKNVLTNSSHREQNFST